ncbi:hypothetical protein DVS28_b0569 (plasmid) [Euzebya pacifica]|uniref:Uncharacterized protein n=1 Tax=Euzebya pacifica TaxID=1608957 RepID=A0A346Y762_9ACTN|nr:hypothetical protein [Euzebya pacifica]AXV10309.1 hypothetical protein DVS28_b0569 [Euzebya pacifica]
MIVTSTCTRPECSAPMRRDGLCFPHLILAAQGPTEPSTPATIASKYSCGESECTEEVHAKGLCKAHYEAARRTGALVAKTCNMDGCDDAHSARGLCARHYMQARRGNREAQAAAA